MLVFSTLHFQPPSTVSFFNSVSPSLLCLFVLSLPLEVNEDVFYWGASQLRGGIGCAEWDCTLYTYIYIYISIYSTVSVHVDAQATVCHTHTFLVFSILFCLKGTGCSL